MGKNFILLLMLMEDDYIALLSTDQIAFTEECFRTVSPGDDYIDNWHIHCIIEHLQALERGEIKRLNINMPPRSLKSITCTIAWTAWLLGRRPSTQIIAASYSAALSTKHSVDTRLILESGWYKKVFPNTIIAKDQNEKAKFQTTERGHRIATSVGGSATGEGADFIISDDISKPDEAQSEVTRNTANEWHSQVLMSRFNNPREGRGLNVMQRLHENDLAGHLVNKGWYSLILPAQFTRKTIIQIGRREWVKEEGEYLQPERMGNEVLNNLMTELGPYAFSGQYMQNPAPIGGGEFKSEHIQYYDNYAASFTAQGMNVYVLYDPANSKKARENDDPDYTAIMVVGLATDNNYYLLDIVRDRLNPTERVELLFELHQKWNKKSGKPPKVISEQYGMMTDNFYIKRKQAELNYRFHVQEVGGKMKKEDRIRRLIPLFESKRVFLPRKVIYASVNGKQHELVKQFVDEEMAVFPVGRHDDMLDALSRIVDEDVRAAFPQISVVYLQAGQSYRDVLNKGFDHNDPMSW